MAQPITDPNSKRICTLSGLEAKMRAEKQLVTLRDARRTLETAILDVTKAHDNERLGRAGEIGARIVLVVCDLIVEYLGNRTGIAGKAVSVLYDHGKFLVDALNGDVTAQKAVVRSTKTKAMRLAIIYQTERIRK